MIRFHNQARAGFEFSANSLSPLGTVIALSAQIQRKSSEPASPVGPDDCTRVGRLVMTVTFEECSWGFLDSKSEPAKSKDILHLEC
jgi:hypothetical protein